MTHIQLILPFFTGLMLGIAQCTSRLFLLHKSISEGFLLAGITATLYLLPVIEWIKVLKSPATLSSAYAIVVLGVFTGILLTKLINSHESPSISIQDIGGILLIFIGSMLIKY